MRRAPAAYRHAIWVAALVVSVLLPIASVRSVKPTAPWQAPNTFPISATPSPMQVVTRALPIVPPAPAVSRRTVPIGSTTSAVFTEVYFLFLLVALVKFTLALRRTIQIRRAAAVCATPALLDQAWTRCLREFGLRDVQLLFSEGTSSPLMTGLLRRSIILPVSLIPKTSEDVLVTAIGHEMAHIARHDFLCNILYELLYIPISFHPAAWILRRRIEQTREIACDELVTRRLLAPQAYARSIVNIATSLITKPRPDYSLGVFDGDILEERIRRLIGHPIAKLRHARLALAGGLLAMVLCACSPPVWLSEL